MTQNPDSQRSGNLHAAARRMELNRQPPRPSAAPEVTIGSGPAPAIPGASIGPDYTLDADGNWVPSTNAGETLDAVMAARRRLLNAYTNAPVQPGAAPRPRMPRGWTVSQMAEYLEANGIQLPEDPTLPPVVTPPAEPPPPAKRDGGRGFDL